MEKNLVERTKTFKWNSRMELYNYFIEKYALDQKIIDHKIEHTIRVFHPRKFQIIKTQELWEKVGNTLECECNKSTLALTGS